MNRSACVVVAFGLATAASTALAAPAGPEPMMMSDAQLDNVTAGDLLTIVLQDSFNNLTFNVGGSHPGNGVAGTSAAPGKAKGMQQASNPHSALSGSTSGTQNNTMVFQVNVISNVNGAIAGGDATAGQGVGTQTLALTPTRH